MKYILFVTSLFFMACTKEKSPSQNYDSKLGQIISIESLKEISLGENDTVLVTFVGGSDGCATPDRLETNIIGNSTTIKAYYLYPSKPTICPQNVPFHVLAYVYKPNAKGTYTYKNVDNDIFVTTVVK